MMVLVCDNARAVPAGRPFCSGLAWLYYKIIARLLVFKSRWCCDGDGWLSIIVVVNLLASKWKQLQSTKLDFIVILWFIVFSIKLMVFKYNVRVDKVL